MKHKSLPEMILIIGFIAIFTAAFAAIITYDMLSPYEAAKCITIVDDTAEHLMMSILLVVGGAALFERVLKTPD